jgi:hypothetical protein
LDKLRGPNPFQDRYSPFGLGFAASANLASLNAADGLLLLNPAQLALRNKPALAADGAQDTALYDLFAEALQELVLRFVGA